jgi:hypothetical protein
VCTCTRSFLDYPHCLVVPLAYSDEITGLTQQVWNAWIGHLRFFGFGLRGLGFGS